ncbi:hypothetical protein BJ508DRAFT_310533 [Ascobolus immersus RN42]|uniref:Uncharacterized protein n=1 Tax=Ascobolus immersus RN42 TaxID=1160509 RepID=A0A3N4HT64_ASCIM|nr:hypothetical protein BJ508DRAFT_310533 [Ascobolus immersus RN42]
MFGTGKKLKQLEIEQAKMQIWMTCTMAIWNFMTELVLSFRLVNDFITRVDYDAGDDQSIETLASAFLTFKLHILPLTMDQTIPVQQMDYIEPWIHLRELIRSQFVLILNAYAAYTYRLEHAHRLKLYYKKHPSLAPPSSSSLSTVSADTKDEDQKEPAPDPNRPLKRNWRFCPAATIMQAVLMGTGHIQPLNDVGDGGPDDDSDLESLDMSSKLTFWDVQNILAPWTIDYKSCSHSSPPSPTPTSELNLNPPNSATSLPDPTHYPPSSCSSSDDEDETFRPPEASETKDRFVTCVFCSQIVDLYCTSDEKQAGLVYTGVKTRFYRREKGEVRDESWIREIYGACHIMFATGGSADEGYTFFGDPMNGKVKTGKCESVVEEFRRKESHGGIDEMHEKMIRQDRKTYGMDNLIVDPCDRVKRAKYVCSVCFQEGRPDGEVVMDKEALENHLKEVHGS